MWGRVGAAALAAAVFSALITLLAAGGVVVCVCVLRGRTALWEEGIKQINFHYMVKAGRA